MTAYDSRRALADAVRRLSTATVSADAPDTALAAAATAVEAVLASLQESAGPGRWARINPDTHGSSQDYFPTSPVIGQCNPVAPPVRFEPDGGDGMVGTGWFDYPYEGPPGCVHGGVIALVFDELLGAANMASGNPGMTGTLTIRYRKPTPLRRPLHLAARTVDRRGRKIRVSGTIHHEGVLTAEAEGLFIEVNPEKFLQMAQEAAADGMSASPAVGTVAGS